MVKKLCANRARSGDAILAGPAWLGSESHAGKDLFQGERVGCPVGAHPALAEFDGKEPHTAGRSAFDVDGIAESAERSYDRLSKWDSGLRTAISSLRDPSRAEKSATSSTAS